MSRDQAVRVRAPHVLASTLALLALAAIACTPSTAHDAAAAVQLRAWPTPRPFDSASSPIVCVEPDVAAALLPTSPSGPLSLRGDPAFHPDQLGPTARYWYDALWDALQDPEFAAWITAVAGRDDLYHYGRTLHTHLSSLLNAFRVTGDLSLLDEVDRLAEHMRSKLRDGWRSTLDGTSGTRDGYLNWVHRYGDSTAHQGKDLHLFNEMRTHAIVAEFTWAFHANRDLTSPNGVDYGQRAQVWTSYLLENFEPKWRERNGVAEGVLPFLDHDSVHSSVAFIKYHHYQAQLTGEGSYATEARRLTDAVLAEFRQVAAGASSAYVWPRFRESSGARHYLQPTTYARYVIGDAVTLHLEDAYRWRDPALVTGLAATVREMVMNTRASFPAFHRDVGGGTTRAGIPPSDAADFNPITENQYAASPYGFAASWDRQGTISTWNCAIHVRRTQRWLDVHLPAGMLIAFANDRAAARADAGEGARSQP